MKTVTKKNISKLLRDADYRAACNQLEYIQECLEYLNRDESQKLGKIKEKHDNNMEYARSQTDDLDAIAYVEKELEEQNYWEINRYDNISQSIVESILIRQVALVEKYIVSLSLRIYEELTSEIDNVILPPNCKITSANKFSDSIKCIKWIDKTLETGFVSSNLGYYKKFQKMREIRHKLAHGEISFKLKESVVNEEYNRFFEFNILSMSHGIESDDPQKSVYFYKISANYKALISFNNILTDFINNIRFKVEEIIT